MALDKLVLQMLRGTFGDPLPCFDDEDTCRKFFEEHIKHNSSNPDYYHFRQCITVFSGWDQLEKYVFPRLERLRLLPSQTMTCDDKHPLSAQVEECLDSKAHRMLSPSSCFDATRNTFEYLYHHMRCGIFVKIHQGRLAIFAPFVNPDYRNTWSQHLKFKEGSLDDYQVYKERVTGKRENVIRDTSKWWLNGNIVCNVPSPQVWGDSFLHPLHDMLIQTCKLGQVGDCEFFLNKRDFPQLRKDLLDPYQFVWPPSLRPKSLDRQEYAVYAPICSFYTSTDFADIPFPTTEDWEIATSHVFLPRGSAMRTAWERRKHHCPWEKRKPVAFFRGSATGKTRIHLAQMSKEGILDAGITKINTRDRKVEDDEHVHVLEDKIERSSFVPISEQQRYKYIIYIDGHCAASRYASLLQSGSTILRVGPTCEASRLWIDDVLKPYDWRKSKEVDSEDHIPVASDLSDLYEVIEWCQKNDKKCEQIKENAATIPITIDFITDYIASFTKKLHERTKGGTHHKWFKVKIC